MIRRLSQVAAGGAVGALARHVLLQLFDSGTGDLLGLDAGHYALAIINAFGSLIIGGLFALWRGSAHRSWLLAGVGFCGGFTSFSGFSLHVAELLSDSAGAAALLLFLTVIACLGAIAVGTRLAGILEQ